MRIPDSLFTAPAKPSSLPSTRITPDVKPEPSPSISYLGKTKVVTLGDTEIRATRNALGINIACNTTNTTDSNRNIRVTVSVGNGTDWVQVNQFESQKVAPGQIGRESAHTGDSYEGNLPADPRTYIDSVMYY